MTAGCSTPWFHGSGPGPQIGPTPEITTGAEDTDAQRVTVNPPPRTRTVPPPVA